MSRLGVLLAFAAALLSPGINAQSNPPATDSNGSACLTATTLDDLTKALDDAVSGPGNKDRTCLRQILLPDARLSPIRKTEDGAFSPRILTTDDWIAAVAKRGNDAFYERQIKVKAETYGHFARLWSTYEIRPTPYVKPEMIVINSVQAGS